MVLGCFDPKFEGLLAQNFVKAKLQQFATLFQTILVQSFSN
jgi:hypothetical protein